MILDVLGGAQYRGVFELRLKTILAEIKESGDVILFIDEVHSLIGTGAHHGGEACDAANMLKPALARGELQVIYNED